MKRVLLALTSHARLAEAIAPRLNARVGRLDWHRFPDGESLVAVDEDLQDSDVVFLASLLRPDEMALPLRFSAATAREFGARSVGLIAPYLAYMRQDKRFHPGEAISAPLFASFLEDSFDWLVTVDPHLHRIRELSALYRIPTRCITAAPLLADWIRANVADAIVIGPDRESEQWVSAIARRAGVPCQVLTKIRRGDRDVEISLPDIDEIKGRTPVLVDDIISSGRTMVKALEMFKGLGLRPATCLAIHAVFAPDAYRELRAAGAARVLSTDSITHESNAISLAGILAQASAGLFGSNPA